MFTEKSADKLCVTSLSNDTLRHRICELYLDIKEQVIQEIKNAGLFSIKLDDSADVQSCYQLMVVVRYVHSGDMKEEFLSCDDLELTTKGEYVLEKLLIGSIFVPMGPLGCFGLDQASSLHCMIYRQALAPKTLPQALLETIHAVIRTVNFVKTSALNPRLFKKPCQDMDSVHEILRAIPLVGAMLSHVFSH